MGARASFIELPESQRIEVLLAELASYPVCGSLWLEVLDTNAGKGGLDLLPQVRKPLRAAGEGRAVAGGPGAAAPAADLPLRPEVFVGLAEPRNSALWPMGIPRLKFPREAPSRSTLKLEEAWHQFIPRSEMGQAPGAGYARRGPRCGAGRLDLATG